MCTLHPASPTVNNTRNHSATIKTRKLTLVQSSHRNYRHHWNVISVSLVSSFCFRIQSKMLHCIQLSYLFSFSQFVTTPSSVMLLAILMSTGQLFCRLCLNFVPIINADNRSLLTGYRAYRKASFHFYSHISL